MLTAFEGLPKPGQESNHKNGDKADNYPANLEWITHKENSLHRCRILGLGLGENNGSAKLTNKDIPIIRRLLARGKLSQRGIAKMFGVCQAIIRDINIGCTWAQI